MPKDMLLKVPEKDLVREVLEDWLDEINKKGTKKTMKNG